jgi:DNA repair protein RadC
MRYATTDRLSDVELVATVIGRRIDDEAVTRLATVLATDGWASGAPLTEIAREYGNVGPRSVAKLECAVELGRRTLAARAARQAEVISTPEDVVRIIKPLLAGQDREHFFACALSTKNKLLRIIEVSVGSLNASIVHPRELFKECVMASAASVVVCHGHPSGDPTPSGADIQLTRRLVKAGDVLGIELLDHVVIGGDEHASLRDLGLM